MAEQPNPQNPRPGTTEVVPQPPKDANKQSQDPNQAGRSAPAQQGDRKQ